MRFALKLTHDEPRLVYLALVYHLGRPGSELDRDTKLPVEHGLREVKIDLSKQLGTDSATIELDHYQYQRLLSAVYGSVNELRVYHMRDGVRSTVERFTETAESLFPEIVTERDEALSVAEAMMMLHRRIERAVGRVADASGVEPEGGAARRKRRRVWPFRR